MFIFNACFVFAESNIFIVNVNRLNLRSEPSLKSKIKGVLTKNSVITVEIKKQKIVKISGRNGQWYYVKTMKGEKGYLFSAYLSELKEKDGYNFVNYYDELTKRLCYQQNINNYFKCGLAIEKYQLEKYSNLAKRDKNTLTLILKNKKTVHLKNGKIPNIKIDQEESYSFYDYLKSVGYFVVRGYSIGGNFYTIISYSTGKKITIIGKNIAISPDGKFLAVMSHDLESGYHFNGLQIIDLVAGKEMYIKEIKNWEPRNPRWKNKNTLNYDKFFPIRSGSKESYYYNHGSLKYHKGKWRLD